MKKLLAIALVLVMVLATGCGGEGKFVFEKGSIKDNVYTNKAADVTFTLPEGWSFSTQEVLDGLMSQAGEIVGEDAAEMAELTTVYDCMAASLDAAANIIFMYENTALSDNAAISENDYAQAVIDGLVAAGISYKLGECNYITIDDKDYYSFITTVDLGEATLEQRYLIRKLDDYMLSMCITTFPGLTISSDDIIAAIS